MSFPESPALTDTEKILEALKEHGAKIDALTDALNGLGQNVQWAIDQGKGIMQMFSSPVFMGQMGSLFGGMANGGDAERPEGNTESGEQSALPGI